MYKQRLKTYQQRFDEKHTVHPNGCWMWNKLTPTHRYGQMRYEGSTQQAHRVSYQLHIGPIPEDMKVLHDCDTPGCVNPAHLFTGTQKDNVDDMYSKGRDNNKGAYPGEKHHNARLHEVDVRNIRAIIQHVPTATHQKLADIYNVGRRQIGKVVTGERWGHVT